MVFALFVSFVFYFGRQLDFCPIERVFLGVAERYPLVNGLNERPGGPDPNRHSDRRLL
jgi:hypothetical protein